MATLATAMMEAGLKAGLINRNQIKKDGTLKIRRRSGCYWPRLRKGQPAWTAREVR